MREYLKIVSSFDEFAEDAQAGVVYYHIDNNVYYWLNLRTIWGYIGYNADSHRFVYSGVDFSVVPRVPDPENLGGPVRIDKESFYTPPTKVTFLHSDFNIFPVQSIYQIGNGKRLVIECDPEDTLPNSRIALRYASGYPTGTEIEYRNLDYSTIQTIASDNTLNQNAFKLVIGETNNVFSNTIDFYPHQNRQSPISSIICEKEADEFDETMVFSPVGVIKRDISVETDIDKIVVKIHDFNGELNTAFRIACGGKTVILDGSQSNGMIGSNFYSRILQNPGSSPYGLFANVQYRNVTDYGGYYKRYLHSGTLLPFPSDMLDMCKTDYVSVFESNKVDVVDDWTAISGQTIDLDGVKYFVYYINSNLPILDWTGFSPIRSEADISAVVDENGRFLYNTTSDRIRVVATQELSNINLLKFGYYNIYALYFNTSDNEITLGELQTNMSFLLGNSDIIVSGTAIDSSGSTNSTISVHRISGCNGRVVLSGLSGEKEISLGYIDNRDTMMFNNSPLVSVAGATTAANPTALDYYNANIEMYRLIGQRIGYDYYVTRRAVTRDEGYRIDVTLLKCIGKGGDFTRTTITTAEHVAYLCNAIPERQQEGTITITRAQRDLFTNEQVTHIQSLGYTVVVQEQ